MRGNKILCRKISFNNIILNYYPWKRFEICCNKHLAKLCAMDDGPNKNTPSSYSVPPPLTQDFNCMGATGRRSKKSSALVADPKSALTLRSTSSKAANPSSPPIPRTPCRTLPIPHRRCPIFKGSYPTAPTLLPTSPTSSAECNHPLTQSLAHLPEADLRLLGRTD